MDLDDFFVLNGCLPEEGMPERASVFLGVGDASFQIPTKTIADFSAKGQKEQAFSDVSFSVPAHLAPFFVIKSIKVGPTECLEGGPVPASCFVPDALNRSLGVAWNGTTPILVSVENIDASPHAFVGSLRAET